MKKRMLGKTGYEVSPIIYAGIVSMDESQTASDGYVSWSIDQGINYFDVAPSYGDAEVKLGNSLKPYRNSVYLACKTEKRMRDEAEKEIHNSLRLFHTDWFDNFQLHAVTSPEDVDAAFGQGGVMELLRDLKEKGVVRKLGISAHSERAAMECLALYPFDTVMFPMNWMLNMGQDIGSKLIKLKEQKNFGLLGIKSFVERAWIEGDDKEGTYPKSWCKPFDLGEDALRLAAMHYSLSVLKSDLLIPPGNFENMSFMAKHIDSLLDKPMSEEELRLLKTHFEKVKDHPFFDKNRGNWPD